MPGSGSLRNDFNDHLVDLIINTSSRRDLHKTFEPVSTLNAPSLTP